MPSHVPFWNTSGVRHRSMFRTSEVALFWRTVHHAEDGENVLLGGTRDGRTLDAIDDWDDMAIAQQEPCSAVRQIALRIPPHPNSHSAQDRNSTAKLG